MAPGRKSHCKVQEHRSLEQELLEELRIRLMGRNRLPERWHTLAPEEHILDRLFVRMPTTLKLTTC